MFKRIITGRINIWNAVHNYSNNILKKKYNPAIHKFSFSNLNIVRSGEKIVPVVPLDGKKVVKEDEKYFYIETDEPLYAVFKHHLEGEFTKFGMPDLETKIQNFAVVELSGTQFKITLDDIIISDKINQDINTDLKIENVLLLGNKEFTVVGRPYIPGSFVMATIEQHTLEEKGVSFKMKRRKRYMRKVGFRREVTMLRVKEINIPGEIASEIVESEK